MHIQDQCSDEQLVAMLDSDESSAQFEPLLQHLESCTQCQKRLDQLAASDAQWHRATQVLTGFSSSQSFRSQPGPTASPRFRHDDHTVTWTESMARQLLSPASHPEMLGRIGRYEVERLIGSGGMGIVFKAIDTELNRPVAIKILAPYLSGSGPARQRFAREAKAAAAVVHEHVVPIHNVETDGQSPFLVMRYVAGESLQARIDREGALDLCQILRIAKQIASGLSAAHSHGLVHRDIKPSNILVESGVERSLITDFGLARAADDASLTNTGYHPGTPQFMSPEQAVGDPIDARSDLFSLGSVMYTMSTGRPPFRAETSYGILRRITDTQPRLIQELNPQIPNWLCGIIAKLMSKSPSERYQSAEEVAKLLELCLAHVQHPTTHRLPAELAQLETLAASNYRKPLKILGVGAVLIVIFVMLKSLPTSPESSGKSSEVPSSNLSNAAENVQQPASAAPTSTPKIRGPRRQPPITPEDRIREQLNVEAEVDIQELSLREAVAETLRASEVKSTLSEKLFEDASIDCTKPCSLRARGTIYSLLNRLCERYQASYIVRESGVEIVPIDIARAKPILRYYDLAFVLPDSANTTAVIDACQQLNEPESWISSGGTFSITVIDSVMVVRASELAHQQIERLLSQLVLN